MILSKDEQIIYVYLWGLVLDLELGSTPSSVCWLQWKWLDCIMSQWKRKVVQACLFAMSIFEHLPVKCHDSTSMSESYHSRKQYATVDVSLVESFHCFKDSLCSFQPMWMLSRSNDFWYNSGASKIWSLTNNSPNIFWFQFQIDILLTCNWHTGISHFTLHQYVFCIITEMTGEPWPQVICNALVVFYSE